MQVRIGLSKDGTVSCSNEKLVEVTQPPGSRGVNYAFQFANGFVIDVHSYYVLISTGDYSTAEFTLFGKKEIFAFDANFSLDLLITEYEPDHICGCVMITQDFADTQDYQNGYSRPFKLRDFELRHTETV